ncbi:unnamed protein product [Heterobilharzia americana]|nr:unnamed protein product [Heterobilharzia americana]
MKCQPIVYHSNGFVATVLITLNNMSASYTWMNTNVHLLPIRIDQKVDRKAKKTVYLHKYYPLIDISAFGDSLYAFPVPTTDDREKCYVNSKLNTSSVSSLEQINLIDNHENMKSSAVDCSITPNYTQQRLKTNEKQLFNQINTALEDVVKRNILEVIHNKKTEDIKDNNDIKQSRSLEKQSISSDKMDTNSINSRHSKVRRKRESQSLQPNYLDESNHKSTRNRS